MFDRLEGETLLALTLVSSLACTTSAPSTVAPPRDPAVCRAEQTQLVELLEQLPAQGRSLELHTSLPISTLGSIVGNGHTLEVSETAVWLNGELVSGSPEAQARQIRVHFETGTSDSRQLPNRVYIATAKPVVVQRVRELLESIPPHIEPRLLFAAPTADGLDLALLQRLLTERDPTERRRLTEQLYRAHARCPAVQAAVSQMSSLSVSQRWKALRAALVEAIPQCDCSAFDREPMGQLLVAEQRAGAASLGSVPANFLRDERCGASIPLQSTQWLMTEIEEFDEQFSGAYRGEAMRFEKVVTNERLQRVLCPALPGETLAALQRKNHTVYWKLPTSPEATSCQGWRFNALEKGSPMGNWHQVAPPPVAGARPVAAPPSTSIHFWQGAEEIRLYGPRKRSDSKATEAGPWSCRQEFRMVGISPQSIELEQGRWFFTRDACEASTSSKDLMKGCIADLALGRLPVPSQSPTENEVLSTAAPAPVVAE